MTPVFITGIGTGIGKTIVSVIVSNALGADYWKPVQSGNTEGTDSETVRQLLHGQRRCHTEVYNLSQPASPHIAARNENRVIDLELICENYRAIANQTSAPGYLVIEGAGGLLVPLNDHEFVVDLVLKLNARVILVSRNYLGSINHSLLTAALCKNRGVEVLGWIFNDEYLQYQDEIAVWSGFPVIGSIPKLATVNRDALNHHALLLKDTLLQVLEKQAL